MEEEDPFWKEVKPWGVRFIFIFFLLLCSKAFVYKKETFVEKPFINHVLSGTSKFENLFKNGTQYDVFMYLNSFDEDFINFRNEDDPFWILTNLKYTEENDEAHVKSVSVTLPEYDNQSLYLHVFVEKQPRNENDNFIYGFYSLNRYKPQSLLLKSGVNDNVQNIKNNNLINLWHPNLTVNLVTDFTVRNYDYAPLELKKNIKFNFDSNYYYPVVYFNDFWNFDTEYLPLNDTIKTLNFTFTFSSLSLLKWWCFLLTEYNVNWIKLFTGEDDTQKSQEMFKRGIMDFNILLFYVSGAFFFFYILMSYEAFQNATDNLWRSCKSYCGFSVYSVCFFIFHAAVGFLYCCCNDVNTYWVVRRYSLITLLFEFWALPKCFGFKRIVRHSPDGILAHATLSNIYYLKPINSVTKVYNEITFKLSIWMFLSCFYTCNNYQNITLPKSYEFSLGLLYGLLTLFSVVIKNLQLFENYQLKTVPYISKHILLYKFYNVFIDDFLSLSIKMPMFYRIGCFGDDLAFVIFIFQALIYRVNATRDNGYHDNISGYNLEHSQKIKKN